MGTAAIELIIDCIHNCIHTTDTFFDMASARTIERASWLQAPGTAVPSCRRMQGQQLRMTQQNHSFNILHHAPTIHEYTIVALWLDAPRVALVPHATQWLRSPRAARAGSRTQGLHRDGRRPAVARAGSASPDRAWLPLGDPGPSSSPASPLVPSRRFGSSRPAPGELGSALCGVRGPRPVRAGPHLSRGPTPRL
jgi:hypothetical protein